ncbi:MAG: hypothetical protein P4L96_03900 [Rhodoferax sp.]|nr:hypothetical protein [Rhodoferax sp.]
MKQLEYINEKECAHLGERDKRGLPRCFRAGGHGVVLAKGAGPGVWNRWRTAVNGYSVLFATVHHNYKR